MGTAADAGGGRECAPAGERTVTSGQRTMHSHRRGPAIPRRGPATPRRVPSVISSGPTRRLPFFSFKEGGRGVEFEPRRRAGGSSGGPAAAGRLRSGSGVGSRRRGSAGERARRGARAQVRRGEPRSERPGAVSLMNIHGLRAEIECPRGQVYPLFAARNEASRASAVEVAAAGRRPRGVGGGPRAKSAGSRRISRAAGRPSRMDPRRRRRAHVDVVRCAAGHAARAGAALRSHERFSGQVRCASRRRLYGAGRQGGACGDARRRCGRVAAITEKWAPGGRWRCFTVLTPILIGS